MRDSVRLDARARVHGRARVQLFRGGRCVRDEAHDNFVSPHYLDAMAWFANWGAFAMDSVSTKTVMSQNGAFTRAPFSGIVLTDYAGQPDPENERLLRGVPLGHASFGVTGGGAARGSYNADESEHRFDYHKFVYDFATSQANGTFQSVYTGPFTSTGIDGPVVSRLTLVSLTTDEFSLGPMVRDFATDAVWICNTTSVQKVVGADIWSIAYGDAPVGTVYPLPATAQTNAFAINGGRLYWLTSVVSSARRILSAPLTDLANYRVEKTIDAAWIAAHGIASVSDIVGFCYHPNRDVFILGNNRVGVGFSLLLLSAADFSDGDAFGAGGAGQFSKLTAFPGETGIVCQTVSNETTRGYVYSFGDSGELVLALTSPTRQYALITTDLMSETDGGSSLFTYVTPAQFFFSRALLDDPVVKTAQDTMKITYEFTFDSPLPVPVP